MQLRRTQAGWEGSYDSATMSDFCYRSRDRRWIFLGALAPSQDESGRRYPLVAGAAFRPRPWRGSQPPAPGLRSFLRGLREQLSSAVENSVEGLACRQFLESQAQLWAGETSDLQLAEEILRSFLERQHPSDLEAAMAGHGPTGILAQALLNITFYRISCAGSTCLPTSRCCRCPSPGAGASPPCTPAPGSTSWAPCAAPMSRAWAATCCSTDGPVKGRTCMPAWVPAVPRPVAGARRRTQRRFPSRPVFGNKALAVPQALRRDCLCHGLSSGRQRRHTGEFVRISSGSLWKSNSVVLVNSVYCNPIHNLPTWR